MRHLQIRAPKDGEASSARSPIEETQRAHTSAMLNSTGIVVYP